MTVNDIIQAHNSCFRVGEFGCPDCPLYEFDGEEENCQKVLMRLTVEKLTEMRDLIDDKINHHYYDTLEFYQEENIKLREKLEAIETILDGD